MLEGREDWKSEKTFNVLTATWNCNNCPPGPGALKWLGKVNLSE